MLTHTPRRRYSAHSSTVSADGISSGIAMFLRLLPCQSHRDLLADFITLSGVQGRSLADALPVLGLDLRVVDVGLLPAPAVLDDLSLPVLGRIDVEVVPPRLLALIGHGSSRGKRPSCSVLRRRNLRCSPGLSMDDPSDRVSRRVAMREFMLGGACRVLSTDRSNLLRDALSWRTVSRLMSSIRCRASARVGCEYR